MTSLTYLRICLATATAATVLAAQHATTWGPVQRTVRYEYRLMNPANSVAENITVYIPLPFDGGRQHVHYLIHATEGYRRTFTDDHGQRLAEYHVQELAPGAHRDFGFVAGVTVRCQQWPTRPAATGTVRLTTKQRERYLAPQPQYSMDSSFMQSTAARLVRGAKSDLEKLTRIHDHVSTTMRYVRDRRWDSAAVVLRRGSGSCSEYNYALSGLCRLAGLPTRYVGGSTCNRAMRPWTDTVFHRWTEVFLDDIGWFPADCSRDADPVRGPHSHFGRVYSDVLVWCRQAGSGQDHLKWEYRGQRRVDGPDPGLKVMHRARWFDWIDKQAIHAAIDWLRDGTGEIPGGDALECAVLEFGSAPNNAQLRMIHALAQTGRTEALRRAATLRLPASHHVAILTGLTTKPRMALRLRQLGCDYAALAKWYRSNESKLAPVGDHGFELRTVPDPVRQLNGNLETGTAWRRLVELCAPDLREQLTAWQSGFGRKLKVACMPAANLTGDTEPTLQKRLVEFLRRSPGVTLVDAATFDYFLFGKGDGHGEFEAWARRERDNPAMAIPAEFDPDVVVVPVCTHDKAGTRSTQRLELRAMRMHDAEMFRATARYTRPVQ